MSVARTSEWYHKVEMNVISQLMAEECTVAEAKSILFSASKMIESSAAVHVSED